MLTPSVIRHFIWFVYDTETTLNAYELPDGNVIIRFRCAEVLFQPISLATRFHDVFFLSLSRSCRVVNGMTLFLTGFLSA